MKLRDSENMLTLGLFLGGAALLAALVLALISQLTAEPIRDAQENNRAKAFHRLRLPDFDKVGASVDVNGILFYPVEKSGSIVGWIGQGTASGYGGEIELLVGFGQDGKITSVQILRHKETPGLGGNVCERKFQRTVLNLFETAPEVPENRWLDQFCAKDSGNGGKWMLSKDGGDVAFLTGATVTSRAVTKGVNDICLAFCAGGFVSTENDAK